MKKITTIAILLFISVALSSCGTSTKQKMQGKWRWESIRQSSGDMLNMMDDELYFIFKGDQYLYHDATQKGLNEEWSKALKFTIDEKTKLMTVTPLDASAAQEHYKVAFTEDGYLNLTIDDASSPLYNSVWIMKKVK